MLKLSQQAKEALLSLLKLTSKTAVFNVRDFAENSLLTLYEAGRFLRSLAGEGLVSTRNEHFEVSPMQRMFLAVEAVKFGANPYSACKYLSWQEFEQAVNYILSLNGYASTLHLKIKVEDKPSEIDIFALKGNIALAIDCKNWKKPLRGKQLYEAVEKQNKRVRALREAENIKNLEVKLGKIFYRKIVVIPVIVTLFEASHRIYEGTPIVPISKFTNFLEELQVGFSFLNHLELP